MADPFSDLSKIRHVQPGDPVSATPTSQPTRAIELRLQQMQNQIDAITQSNEFSKFIIHSVPIKTGSDAVAVDDIVYYNAGTGLYEKAIAGVTIISGTFDANPTALALGVCVATSGAFGDVMIAGYDTWRDAAHQANMIEATEVFTPGVPYYLSAATLGKLTRFPPAIQIQMIVATAKHYVLKPIYGIPDTQDNPTKQGIGMRPVGSLRMNPNSFAQFVIVAFDALELVSPDPGNPGYGAWRSSAENTDPTIPVGQFGYMVADAVMTQQPAFPVYARISVDTSGAITACQATNLAMLDYSDGGAYNKISSFPALIANANTIRTYPLLDQDGVTQIGTLSFKFTTTDLTYRRDVIFKIPDTFQGWKMINPPLQAAATAVISAGVIISATIVDAGIGYDTPPAIVITGDGTGAAARAVLDGNGSIASIHFTSGGTGYTTATITIHHWLAGMTVLNAGAGAAATATTVGSPGPIGTVTITLPGTGYNLPPSATIVDLAGTGSGAVLNARVINGLISEIDVVSAGTNYTSPVVLIRPAANHSYRRTKQATYSFTLSGSSIATVSVIDGGFGHPVGARLIANNSPTPSVFAVLVPTFDEDGAVVSVAVSSGGTGYTSPVITALDTSDPSLVILGVGLLIDPPTGTVTTLAMSVERVEILSGGAAYDPASTITFSAPGGGGITATGRLVIDIDGHIASVVITNPGSNYQKLPTVTITDPGGNGNHALLKAHIGTIVNSVAVTHTGDNINPPASSFAGTPIDHIEVDDIGSGYSGTPSVHITAPEATPDLVHGVQATAVALMGQQIGSVIVSNGGFGYTTPNDWSISVTGGGGSGAVILPIFSGGVLVDTQIINPGSGYNSTPALALVPSGSPPGSGGLLQAVMEGLNCVVGVQLTNAGRGYAMAPTITIDPPGGVGLTARASAKMVGTGALLQPTLAGQGGLHYPIGTGGQGNGLQIYGFQDDLADNISSPLHRPLQGVFYYNMKADPLLKSKYPSIPPERSIFMLNGTELTGTAYNELTGIAVDIDADVIFFRKSPFWTTFDVNGCPWDVEYRAWLVDLGAQGVDQIIPKSGPIFFEDSWFLWWEHVFKYEVSRNRAWIHVNRGSRFFQTGRVLSLAVLPPFKLVDVATGAEAKNDGTPMTGQLLLTFDNQEPFLTGNTGSQLDTTMANKLVSIYKNNTSRPVMIGSLVLLVSYQLNASPTVAPTVADDARITVGTQAGNYRDIIGTLDPTALVQQGVETKLYAVNQVKELFPDTRDAAPLIMPGVEVFIRVDSPASGNITTQLLTARVRGYLF